MGNSNPTLSEIYNHQHGTPIFDRSLLVLQDDGHYEYKKDHEDDDLFISPDYKEIIKVEPSNIGKWIKPNLITEQEKDLIKIYEKMSRPLSYHPNGDNRVTGCRFCNNAFGDIDVMTRDSICSNCINLRYYNTIYRNKFELYVKERDWSLQFLKSFNNTMHSKALKFFLAEMRLFMLKDVIIIVIDSTSLPKVLAILVSDFM